MVSWILVLLVIIALVVFFKTTGVRFGHTWTILIGAVILFFVVSFGYVISKTGSIDSFESFVVLIRTYVVWLGGAFDNAATITGDVINSNWSGNISEVASER